MSDKITVALAGNPNSGKTTVFNCLTGSRQKVANYPGVTVESKKGGYQWRQVDYEVYDLPGTYCLSPYSEEELVTRHFILDEHPDVVAVVLDSSNLERNLYIVTQLIEMQVPLVLAFNMSDISRRRGLVFDTEQLSRYLGGPIVEVVGHKGKGIEELKTAIADVAGSGAKGLAQINYGFELEEEIGKIRRLLKGHDELVERYGLRWLSVKLLERDSEILELVDDEQVSSQVGESAAHIRHIFGDEPEIILADKRYGFISGACQETVVDTVAARHDVSDMIDNIVTHSVMGLPIFALMMYVVFVATFELGKYPVMALEWFFGFLSRIILVNWPGGDESMLCSLVVDGVIGGVGGVLVFLPNILILFMAIALLEDTGYMSRAAFVMDRLMHKIGLHGKSFIPMIIGFGCSVPAIMATRILENKRNRLTTMLVIPLMSCGARLPIYILFISAFFSDNLQGPMMWLMYVIGIIAAVISAKLLRKTLFKGQTVPFVMELSPYRIPTLSGLLIHTWDRGKEYIKKAGTVILAASVILWGATTFPVVDKDKLEGLSDQKAQAVKLRHSAAGRVGLAMEPVLKYAGLDWKTGTALIGAFAAKEIFVSQLSIIYAVGQEEGAVEKLKESLRQNYSRLEAFCIMLFCLIGLPCLATVAITKKESGSWKWAFFQLGGLTLLAYLVCVLVYQTGSLLTG